MLKSQIHSATHRLVSDLRPQQSFTKYIETAHNKSQNQGRWSEGRARGSKGNARALKTNHKGSKPKIGWIRAPPAEKFLRPDPLDRVKILSKIF